MFGGYEANSIIASTCYFDCDPRAQSAMAFQSGSFCDVNWRPPLWKLSPPAVSARGCLRIGLDIRFAALTNLETASKFCFDCSSVHEVAPGASGCRRNAFPAPAWHTTQRAWPSRFLRKIGSTLAL